MYDQVRKKEEIYSGTRSNHGQSGKWKGGSVGACPAVVLVWAFIQF